MNNRQPVMRYISFCLVALSTTLIPTEGHVSRVHYEHIGLAFAAERIWHAVEATNLDQTEVFRRVVLPKETSHDGAETIYQERVSLYRVDRVVESPTIKEGDVLHVWKQPEIGLDVVDFHHRSGGYKSPIVQRYEPMVPSDESKTSLLLLGATVQNNNATAYQLLGTESMASEAAVRAAMQEHRATRSDSPPVIRLDAF